MDKTTKGAWIIHHGRKVAGNLHGAAQYSAIDIAAKSTLLLARMAESQEVTLTPDILQTLARVGGLNPKTELDPCLRELEALKLIDRASSGEVVVLGITSRTALGHAADVFDSNQPEKFEAAALGLGELVSIEPVSGVEASERISDTYHLSKTQTADFLSQSSLLGFVDVEGDSENPLYFNGNLFRRGNVEKTKKVLDSLTGPEQKALVEFNDRLKREGSIYLTEAHRMLGDPLLSKLRAAAVFDENVVSNEAGDHSFITSPGAFHKFSNPLEDDAFDHAKALVSALSYGMHVSDPSRGSIWGVDFILKKLLRGNSVGPVPAIGKDYRAREFERVVKIETTNRGYTMRLLKREVGEIALQVLSGRNATPSALDEIPGAQVTGYTGPESSRARFRKKKEMQPSSSQMQSLLRSVRSSGGL